MKLTKERGGRTACVKGEIFFSEGIVGFAEHKRFYIDEQRSREPFLWLQSSENRDLSFILINPKECDPGYDPMLSEQDKNVLQINDISSCQCFSIVFIPKDSDRISVNLLAPIVINKSKQLARQIVLQDQDYSVQHLILDEMMKQIGEKDVSSFAKTK